MNRGKPCVPLDSVDSYSPDVEEVFHYPDSQKNDVLHKKAWISGIPLTDER